VLDNLSVRRSVRTKLCEIAFAVEHHLANEPLFDRHIALHVRPEVTAVVTTAEKRHLFDDCDEKPNYPAKRTASKWRPKAVCFFESGAEVDRYCKLDW
jgi:hypothetical protein